VLPVAAETVTEITRANFAHLLLSLQQRTRRVPGAHTRDHWRRDTNSLHAAAATAVVRYIRTAPELHAQVGRTHFELTN